MRLSQSVAASYVVEESGHELIFENVFVKVDAARSCEGETSET